LTATDAASLVKRSKHQLTPRLVDTVAEFKKGVKRDIAAYPVLKLPSQWDVWK
jgi:hypothetical protein